MKQETHDKMQKSLDRMHEYYDELSVVMQKLCTRLGDMIGYVHKPKSEYRIYVITGDGREYDVDDLIEQAEQYLKKKKKS